MIRKVFYHMIDTDDLDGYDPNEYFYHQNMIDVGDFFAPEYESYELMQRRVMDQTIKKLISSGAIQKPQLESVSMMMSTLKNTPILVIEV